MQIEEHFMRTHHTDVSKLKQGRSSLPLSKTSKQTKKQNENCRSIFVDGTRFV